MTTTQSHDASGVPSGRRATRSSATIMFRTSMPTPEVSSEAEPRWTIIALSGRPVERSAAWNPDDIDSRIEKTATTSAMPEIASSVTCQRTRTFRMLYEIGRAIGLDRPQDVGDLGAVGRNRGDETGEEPEHHRRGETGGCDRGLQLEAGESDARQDVGESGRVRQNEEKRLAAEDTKRPAEHAEKKRLAHHEPHDVTARETERLQHADFGATFAHGHAHRVRGDEQDRERHGGADSVEQKRQVPGHRDEPGLEGLFRFRER